MLSLMAAANLLASFGAMADDFWSSPIFARDSWNNLMFGLRVALTLGGALLLLYEWRARKLGERFRERTMRRVGIVLTVLAFGVYFDFFNPNVRYRDYYHRHEYFHYYLGSKYNKELSYTRIYECTAVAEIENGRRAQVERREIRDLRVNLIKQYKDTEVGKDPEFCKKHFRDPVSGEVTPAWESFKKDVAWFEERMRGDYWANAQKDHGYNPPPVWTMGGKFFSSFGAAGHDFFLTLSGLDIAFHLGTILLFGWAFGWRVMTVAAIFWGCNAPANFYWTGGAFMRQDWLFFLVAALCLVKKRYFALGGAALTWSALLRAFPLILFFGWGVMVLFHLIRHRKFHPDHKRLIAGAAIAGAVLVPLSAVVTANNDPNVSYIKRLAQPYVEFVGHIAVHKDTPLTNTMGLETILVHDWKGRMRFTRNDNLDDPFEEWKFGRLDRIGKVPKNKKPEEIVEPGFRPLKWVYRGTILLVMLWSAWALRRTKFLWVGLALSPPLVMCLTNLTCYYYSVFMVCAALTQLRPMMAPMIIVVSGASQILLRSYYWVDDKYTAQSYLFFVFSLLLLWGISRPFSMERLKAWWEGKPEPKSPPKLPAKEPAPAE